MDWEREFEKDFHRAWWMVLLMAIVYVGFLAVVIWAIVKLVLHFTG